jgi:hypothetical protein
MRNLQAPRSPAVYNPRVSDSRTFFRSATVGLSAVVLAGACDSQGTIPLALEVKDGAAGGGSGKGDEVEIVVKTIPGVDLTYAGQTKSLGDKATESFAVPKSGLKLGKNTFTVAALKGGALGKQTATATVDWDATPKGLVRVFAVGGDTEATLSCSGTMCGTSAFKATKAGKLPIEIESALDAQITIEGQTATASPGKRGKVEVDLLTKLPKATVGQTERVALGLQMDAGGAKAEDTLELAGPLLADLAAVELAKVERGPVPFPGDAAGGDPRMLVAVGVPGSKLVVVGKAGTFADVDLVALAKPVERFFGCGKTDAAGIIYTDLEVTVYDRRTAKQVGTRKLRADRVACPATPTAGQLRGAVREDDVRRVLGEMLKK